MVKRFFLDILAGIIGLYLAIKVSQSHALSFISGINYNGPIKTIIIAGGFLGLADFFIKPVLKLISFPLKIITFGLSSILVDMFIVWLVVDIFSPIEINGLIPLFWATIIVWVSKIGIEILSPTKK